jgi:antitoxin component HigA of HigAB toxin-antitoxin module
MSMTKETIQHWNALQDSVGGILQPIQNDAHYDQLSVLLDDLLDSTPGNANHPLRGLLEIVTKLIEDFDRKHPLELSKPHEMLAWYIESKAINQVQLAKETGIDQSLISKHLQQKRPISKNDAKVYAQFFDAPMTAFFEI